MPEHPVGEDEMLSRLGITPEPVCIYHYRDWRYSNLDDALAQARRDAAKVNS